jgi:LuxR family transcriptional regulator, maltose regulon positive regulatory protein
MLLAELERREPDLIPVLRRRAAAWYLRNGMPEEALEYSIAAGDVEMGARLVEELMLPTYRQGRVTTLQRWFRWLEDRGGIAGRPMAAVWASILAARTGRPVEAERWAVAVDRWQYENAARPDDPAAEGWAAVLRALLCRQGVQQMRTDADEAARLLAVAGIVAPAVPLFQGIAQVLSGDHDGGDASFSDAIGTGHRGAPDVLAAALCERSLLAMARGDWGLAEDLAGQARAVLREARIEDSYITPLVCAAQARAAWHRGDSTAARQQLAGAQRLRPVLTYAIPHLAVQARIELARVHLALTDMGGARTLMREVNEILNRRPDLGTLTDEAQALRAQLSARRGPSVPGASSLTAAELRVLPLLATHLSIPEIGAALFLSPNTVKSQAISLYRKLGANSRSQAVARSRELALLDG